MAEVAAPHGDNVALKEEPKSTLTPPASEEAGKHDDSSSDLSDLDMEQEDIGDIEPAYYYEGGKIPVFTPTMRQFENFKKFVDKIDKYGMKSGIVKVIPPKEWRDSLPDLDTAAKRVKVKNPITQEFHGTHGTYTQANMEKQRSYNLPQWRALCEESNHQPPAKRGERRRNQEKSIRSGAASRPARKQSETPSESKKRGPGRPRVRPMPASRRKNREEVEDDADSVVQEPPTPTSPPPKMAKVKKETDSDGEEASTPTKSRGRQPKSVTSRRKNNREEQADFIDEEAFQDFDYRIYNQDEWTSERCQELETAYWKSLTFNNPMYGADMPGSLFDDTTTSWNVAKLENLLDVLGQKVPGVNTAYLYLGMWKATFAWHLEDVDLYSINYIHFGAPKQWYSISQADARRFEAAMRNIWPQDAKNCDQFLRHKTYLISPQILKSQFNIEVNRLVHREGEFVITFPYGYHSGYNLGYNCAESVNFATEAWLEYGKIARKCNCEDDNVWVDVWDVERRLRGEPTPEYYEETEDDEDDEDPEEPGDLPTPPGSENGKARSRGLKRKRETKEPKVNKKIKIKLKAPVVVQPCVLCPNNPPLEELLCTDTGKGQAHRRCAEYIPETWISVGRDLEIVRGIDQIDKARFELRCIHCRSKHGAQFQCSAKKCVRAYHATCAWAAGVQIDHGLISVYDEDGTEYAQEAYDFRCRFHRPKRSKYADRQACSQALEDNTLIRKTATKLQKGDIIQYQYYLSDIFAGCVVENRTSEKMLLLESIPGGAYIEVEYKWVLVLDKASSQLQPPSENAKPLPAHLLHKNCATEHPANEIPKPDDPFLDANGRLIWAEFHSAKPQMPLPLKIDFSKEKRIWHYLGKTSTEAKAQYTADIAVQINDPAANFLDSVKPVVAAAPPPVPRQSYPASYPTVPGRAGNLSGLHGLNKQIPNFYSDLMRSIQQDKNRGLQPLVAGKLPQTITAARPSAATSVPLNSRLIGGPNDRKTSVPAAHANTSSSLTATSKNLQAPFASMANSGSGAVPMRTVADPVRPASSIPQQSLEDIRRLQAALQSKSSKPQMPVQTSSQQAAPVANMMPGATSPITQSPFSRPSTSYQTPPSSAHSSIGSRSRSDSMKMVAKYPYLQQCASRRDAVYQSPYLPGPTFGITEAYLPVENRPTKPMRPRAGSLAQDYLNKQPPSQRERVQGHVRTISTEKAMLQAQESERRQREHSERHRRNSSKIHAPLSPSLLQNSAIADDLSFPNSPGFSDFGPSYPNHHSYGSMLPQDPLHYPQSFHHHSAGLQFSSPQEFQLQMQRESQAPKPPLMTHEKNSYRAFVDNFQSSNTVGMLAHSHPSQEMDIDTHHGDGTSGSPLRRGMRAAGGEMLPMMQDSSHGF